MQFTTHSAAETLVLGENLGKLLEPGDIVLLFGDLGAGKTLLIQGIARGLGLKENEYTRSPSFTLINEYQGRIPIYHIDLYRIESFSEIENLGLEELFSSKGATLVEWAEKLFPSPQNSPAFDIEEYIEIRIDIVDENTRQYDIRHIPPHGKRHPIFSLQ